mgnify:CR=1 FL=1|tara:strand:- start:485 stop:817 length:333 start_codon:yes stop_codon:yes gene_type:complete
MIKNVAKRPPNIKDPELSRIVSAIYDDMNELTNRVNQTYDTGLPAKSGDIKVIGKIFYYHTGNEWKSIDVDQINRSLFSSGAVEVADEFDSAPLQTQVNRNRMFTFLWSN